MNDVKVITQTDYTAQLKEFYDITQEVVNQIQQGLRNKRVTLYLTLRSCPSKPCSSRNSCALSFSRSPATESYKPTTGSTSDH